VSKYYNIHGTLAHIIYAI